MSTYYIPPPDYGIQAQVMVPREDPNTYIPEPDYTSGRRINSIPEEPEVDYQTYIKMKTEIAVEEKKPMKESREIEYVRETTPPPKEPVDKHKHSYVPIMPIKIQKHSYLEDREETVPEYNKSIRSHIRSIGVPVLPFMKPPTSTVKENEFVAVDPSQNQAFIRHLANHRKYDTMKSLRSCQDCPICQIMTKDPTYQIHEPAKLPKNNQNASSGEDSFSSNQESPSSTRGRRGDVRNLFADHPSPAEEIEELNQNIGRAKRAYTKKHEGEMSVEYMEKLEVKRQEKEYVLCRKMDGTLGWLPAFVIL